MGKIFGAACYILVSGFIFENAVFSTRGLNRVLDFKIRCSILSSK